MNSSEAIPIVLEINLGTLIILALLYCEWRKRRLEDERILKAVNERIQAIDDCHADRMQVLRDLEFLKRKVDSQDLRIAQLNDESEESA